MKFSNPKTANAVYFAVLGFWILLGLAFYFVWDNFLATLAYFAGAFLVPDIKRVQKIEEQL